MEKEKTRKKRLLIGNSDRYYNFSLISETVFDNVIKITQDNQQEYIEKFDKDLLESKKSDPLGLHYNDDNTYRINSYDNIDDKLVDYIILYGNKLDYITDKQVSADILNKLSIAKNREIFYKYSSLDGSTAMVNNIIEAHKSCITSVYVELDPLSNINDLIFKLYPYRTNIDNLYIRFKKYSTIDENMKDKFSLLNGKWDILPEFKFNIFKILQTSLSTWAINIQIITGKDILDLKNMAYADRKRGKKPKLIKKVDDNGIKSESNSPRGGK